VTRLENEVKFNQYCCFLISDVTIYLIYRSPNAPPEAMDRLVELVRGVKGNSLLIGDFNLPDINWETGESSRRTEDFVDALDDLMLTQMVHFATHIKGNCLDLMLTNIPERVMDVSEGGRLGSSDHEMVDISVRIGGFQGSAKMVKNWRKANWKAMREEIGGIDWRRELEGLTVNRMWETLRRKVDKAVKKHVPTRLQSCRGRPMWMTREIMAALSRKKKMWRKVKGSGITDEYRKLDKEVKKKIRNAKRGFEKKLADGNGNSRQFFAYVRKKTKSRPTVGPLRDKNKKVVTEDEDMATLLNEFFSSVFSRDEGEPPEAEEMETSSLENISITAWKVKKKIRNLKPTAAAGPDEIGPRLLQELENEVAEGLAIIFRRSMDTGTCPEDWRDANVTPIFKKGTKADPGNYRPVSLTSICCKMLESIIKDDMMEH
jgi:hypothetical protein